MSSQTKTSSQLSRYRILGLVGQGQFGQVFCAMHRKTGKLFALKNLEHERFPTHQFLRELRFLLSLQHSNIVSCHAIEHTRTGRYLVMDYCEGGTLRSLMVEDVALPLTQGIQIVADVLRGLACAHKQGIVHCDVKPENILLTLRAKGWLAKISDFGIARLNKEVYSQSTGNTGSPAYMAPERFYSQYSAASDIYAVGILLFELLAGHRPFSGTPKALMAAHLNESVVCPDVIPAGLQGVINIALQKLPARRFQSATEMLDAIQSVVNRMDGFWEKAVSIETPLLVLRQKIPYYDSNPQNKEVFKYAVDALDGLVPSPLSASGQQRRGDRNGDQSIAVRANPSTEPYPSFIGCTGAGHFTYRAIASIDPDDKTVNSATANSPSTSTNRLNAQDMGWRSLQLPDPIDQLLPAPQGYFLSTRRTIYWVDMGDDFEPSLLSHFSNTSSPSNLAPLVAQPIYELEQDCVAAIDPQGHWLALVTDLREVKQQAGEFSTLRFQSLPHQPGAMALAQSSLPLRVAGRSKTLLKAIALDTRHVAIISDSPHPKSKQSTAKDSSHSGFTQLGDGSAIDKTMNRATYIEVFTRRGQRIALKYLPICLGNIATTPQPYRLLATDRADPTSVLCIDLKPFRIQRFALDIKPQFLAATNWGYIVADVQGHIVFLDTSGYAVSALHGPPHLTAMTFLAPQWLFLSTWHNGQGCLYTLDLKQQMTNWVF